MHQRPTEITIRNHPTQPVFWGGLRTPFTVAQRGFLKDTRPDDLLANLILAHRSKFQEAYAKDGAPSEIVTGCAYPEGEQGYNIARIAALAAGLELPGMTVNRLCGSSLEAAAIAAGGVASGRSVSWLVSGVESMSRVTRRGANFSESDFVISHAPTAYVTMGETAENLARRYPSISRGAQEEFAAGSHGAAHRAWESGFYDDHVVARRCDESIRYPVSLEKMASLAPAFTIKAADGHPGVVTAATSSPMSDGACVGLVTSEEIARDAGAKSFLRILDTSTGHVPPELMGLGPVPAVQKIFQRNRITSRDLAAVEMNEAFAIQTMACIDELKIDPAIVNAWGGALALGHPLGASGLRLLMTLQNRMAGVGTSGHLGLVTLCIGGGQGIAMLCEFVAPNN